MTIAAPPLPAIATALAPYRALLEQVDQLCARIIAGYGEQLACRAGCDGCCILQGVLPVEAAHLHLAWRALPARQRNRLRRHLAESAPGESCPLLTDGLCPLYAARPVICRTHGLPLLVEEAGDTRVDHCPLNFTGLDTLPGTAVIDLDRLNTVLVAVNRQFVARLFPAGGLPDRIPLRQIVSFPLVC